MEATPVRQFENNLSNCSSFEQLSLSIRQARVSLEESSGQSKLLLHAHLCRVLIESANEFIVDLEHSGSNDHTELLFSINRARAFDIMINNISNASYSASIWIENEIIKMMKNKAFDSIIQEQSSCTLSELTLAQKKLITGFTRLPDLLSSRRKRQLSSQLLPINYFNMLSRIIFNCLQSVYTLLGESKDCSLKFLATLTGKVSFLGHRESFWNVLCSKLESATKGDHLWRRISHNLFSRICQQHLEATLDGVLQYITPSLQPSSSCSPLWCVIGDLPLTNPHAKYLLTHKYITIRPVHNLRSLIGYLANREPLQPLLMESLLHALNLWSDRSCLRHIKESLHKHLCGVILLGMTCSSVKYLKPHMSKFQELLMQGVQVHLEITGNNDMKHIGMATGEFVMNKLYPSVETPLKFSCPNTESVVWLKSFMKPLSEQENETLLSHKKLQVQYEEDIDQQSKGTPDDINKSNGTTNNTTERFGVGFVHTTITNENDSDDDDLQSYDMSNDQDSTQSPLPRYLRECLQGLLSKDNYSKHGAALKALKPLIVSRPSDLPEVCVELIKVLLHLEDIFSVDEFVCLRQDSLVELTYACPTQAAPYLCEQFYSPHYTITQRMDILESLTKAALKLSTPASTKIIKEHSIKGGTVTGGVEQVKSWQKIVEERIKAKTRIISKVSNKKKEEPVANDFSSVCGEFFFPLMTRYDTNIPTLDLQGRDSLLLGQLLHALGTIIHLSLHCPLVPVMAASLLDFCWSFKYHSDISVRQSVLYCMCCLLSSVPGSTLPLLLEKGLDEMMLWMKDIISNDANQQCRHLANLSLSMFNELIKTM